MEIEEFLFRLEENFKLVEERKRDLVRSFSEEMTNMLLEICKDSIPVSLIERDGNTFLNVVIPERVEYPKIVGRSLTIYIEHDKAIRRFTVSKKADIVLNEGYEFKGQEEVKFIIEKTYEKIIRTGILNLDYFGLGEDTVYFGVLGFVDKKEVGNIVVQEVLPIIFEYLRLQ